MCTLTIANYGSLSKTKDLRPADWKFLPIAMKHAGIDKIGACSQQLSITKFSSYDILEFCIPMCRTGARPRSTQNIPRGRLPSTMAQLCAMPCVSIMFSTNPSCTHNINQRLRNANAICEAKLWHRGSEFWRQLQQSARQVKFRQTTFLLDIKLYIQSTLKIFTVAGEGRVRLRVRCEVWPHGFSQKLPWNFQKFCFDCGYLRMLQRIAWQPQDCRCLTLMVSRQLQ